MTINGRLIADEIKQELAQRIRNIRRLSLTVFVVDRSLATQKFMALKKRVAEEIGVTIVEHPVSPDTTTGELEEEIKKVSHEHEGIVVQFPLPPHIDRDVVRNAIPETHDVDVISDAAYAQFERGLSGILPPVAGAIKEILNRADVSLPGKRVVVVGDGRLVGKPSAAWASREGGDVVVATEKDTDISSATHDADVIILGVGFPGLLRPDMVKEGVVILDAGTSEAKGKLAGDADPACAEKASLFTPVPGGIGPVAVAMIFKNLLELSERYPSVDS